MVNGSLIVTYYEGKQRDIRGRRGQREVERLESVYISYFEKNLGAGVHCKSEEIKVYVVILYLNMNHLGNRMVVRERGWHPFRPKLFLLLTNNQIFKTAYSILSVTTG